MPAPSFHWVALTILAAAQPALRAQETTSRPSASTQPDTKRPLEELATRVRAAHRTEGAPRTVESFRAKVDVKALSRDKNLEVSLNVRWKSPDLMRYQIDMGETHKERGVDEDGEWEIVGDKLIDLQEQRSDAGLVQVQRHLQLCKQLVRFLDPADVLGELLQPAPLRQETVALAPNERAVPCVVAEGYLRTFPLYHVRLDEEVKSVRCEFFFAADTGRLRALRAFPLDARAKQHGDGEWVVLLDQQSVQGLLLPKTIVVSALRSPGLEQVAKISVQRIDLAPNLGAAEFRRPK